MRRLFWGQMMSLDGFMAGPNGELDWHVTGHDFAKYVEEMGKTIGSIVFGRKTYEMMAGYWPTSDQPEAPMMNDTPKLVFSRTLKEVTWKNARLAKGDVAAEIRALKAQGGSDIAMFGSTTLASAMMRQNLIDEYRIFVNPVVLGAGMPLFNDVGRKLLELTKVERHESGTVALYYKPRKG